MSDEKKSEELIVTEIPEVAVEIDEPGTKAEDASSGSINDIIGEQDREAEEFAIEFFKKILRLRGVRIGREQFLKAELHKRGISDDDIYRAITENPAGAGISPAMLDEMAEAAIDFETKKSTALSFAAGLPGGFAMIGTVPADITQFYVHAFRVMQKVAYIYGWQSFLKDTEDIDDETLGKLAAFLGVMMGVGGASTSVKNFAIQVARPAIQKKIANTALTKTAWYLPMKQTLRIVGIQVTKQSFAKTVTKVVPVVGGVVSGGLTFVTLNTQSKRLMKHLREIPPPNVDAAEHMAAVKRVDEVEPDRTKALSAAVGDAVSDAAAMFRSVDLDGDGVPDEARAKTAAKGAASAVRGVVSGAADKVRAVGTDGDKDPDTAQNREATEGADSPMRGAAAGATGKLGSFLRRKRDKQEAFGEADARHPVDTTVDNEGNAAGSN